MTTSASQELRSASPWILVVGVTSVILGCGVALLLSLEPLRNLFLNLVPAGVLAVGAAAIRRQEASWLSPGAFFALVWATLVWAALILAPNLTVWHGAIWWIVLSCAAVYAGSLLGGAFSRRSIPDLSFARTWEWPLLRVLIALSSLVGLFGVFVLLRAKGGGLGTLVSAGQLGDVARAYSIDRYLRNIPEPALGTALAAGTYAGAFLSGCLLALPDAKNRWVGLLPLVPAFGQAAVLTTKASVLVVLAILVSSYVGMYVATPRDRGTKVLSGPTLWAIILLPITAGFFLFVQLIRYNYSADNPAQIGEVLNGLQVAAFGYLGGFSGWLQTGEWASASHSWGSLTFAGPFQVLGVAPRVAGLYENAAVDVNGVATNISTVFRGLIVDFSPLGALLFLLILGAIAGWAYRRAQAGSRTVLPFLVGFYLFVIYGFLINPFGYNTVITAWLLFAVYMWMFRTRVPHWLS